MAIPKDFTMSELEVYQCKNCYRILSDSTYLLEKTRDRISVLSLVKSNIFDNLTPTGYQNTEKVVHDVLCNCSVKLGVCVKKNVYLSSHVGDVYELFLPAIQIYSLRNSRKDLETNIATIEIEKLKSEMSDMKKMVNDLSTQTIDIMKKVFDTQIVISTLHPNDKLDNIFFNPVNNTADD